MDTYKLIGKILVTARHIASNQVVATTILFKDRGDSIYYCWDFRDVSGTPIASKCLPISKKIIDTDEFDFAINHSKSSIDNYKISRQNIFEVLDIKKE
jgi:hypothetical protein